MAIGWGPKTVMQLVLSLIVGVFLLLMLLNSLGMLDPYRAQLCADNPWLCGVLGIDIPSTEERAIAAASIEVATKAIEDVMSPVIDEDEANATCMMESHGIAEYCKKSLGYVCPHDAVFHLKGYGRANEIKCCYVGNCEQQSAGFSGISQDPQESVVSFQGLDITNSLGSGVDKETDSLIDDMKKKFEIKAERTRVLTQGQLWYEAGWVQNDMWYMFDPKVGWKYRCDNCADAGLREWKNASSQQGPGPLLDAVDETQKDIIFNLRMHPNDFEAGIQKIAEFLNAGTGPTADDNAVILWEHRIIDLGEEGGENLGSKNDRFASLAIGKNDYVTCLWDIIEEFAPKPDMLEGIEYRWHGGDADASEDMWFVFYDNKWHWKAPWADNWEIKSLDVFFKDYWGRSQYKEYIDDVSLPVIVRRLQSDINTLRKPEWRYRSGIEVLEDMVNRFEGTSISDDSLWFHYKTATGQSGVFPDLNDDKDSFICLRKMMSPDAPVEMTLIHNFQLPQDVSGWEDALPYFGDPDFLWYWQSFPEGAVTWNYDGDHLLTAAIIIATSLPPFKLLGELGKAGKAVRLGLKAAKSYPTKFTLRLALQTVFKKQLAKNMVSRMTETTILKQSKRALGAVYDLGKGITMKGGKIVFGGGRSQKIFTLATFAVLVAESYSDKYDKYGNSLVFKEPLRKPEVGIMKPEARGRLFLLNYEPGRAIPGGWWQGGWNWIDQVFSFERGIPLSLVSPCNLKTSQIVPFVAECELYEHQFYASDNEEGNPTYFTACYPDKGDQADPSEFSGKMKFDMGGLEPSCLLPLRFVSDDFQSFNGVDPFDIIREKDVNEVLKMLEKNSYISFTKTYDEKGKYIERITIGSKEFDNFPVYHIVDTDGDGKFDEYITEGTCKIDGALWVVTKNSKVPGGNNYCFDERGGLQKFLEYGGITVGAVGFAAATFFSGGTALVLLTASSAIGAGLELGAVGADYVGEWPGSEV